MPTSKAYLKKVDAELRRKAADKNCTVHRRKKGKLIVLWADGRAWMVSCSRECFLAWEQKRGRWACVVRVIPVLE